MAERFVMNALTDMGYGLMAIVRAYSKHGKDKFMNIGKKFGRGMLTQDEMREALKMFMAH